MVMSMDIDDMLVDFVNGVSRSNLSSFRSLNDTTHLQNTVKHIRREGPKYSDVNYHVEILKDSEIQETAVADVRHFVFDMGFDTMAVNQIEFDIDIKMRRLVLKSAYYRIVNRYFDDKVRAASIVGDENINSSGEIYEMYDALHIIFEGLTKEEESQIIYMFDLYFDTHGYAKIS